jgi:microcompartment protein CcmK/EutM
MVLAKVVKRVVATQKNPYLKGYKLLMLRQVTPERIPLNKPPILAIDMVDAGVGDIVLVMQEGGSARLMVGNNLSPVRSVIVGVVDGIEIGK